jgi:CobQ-like glutamine amidotransferase family enzyme
MEITNSAIDQADQIKNETSSQILRSIAKLFEEHGDHGNALLLRDRAKIESIAEEADQIIKQVA